MKIFTGFLLFVSIFASLLCAEPRTSGDDAHFALPRIVLSGIPFSQNISFSGDLRTAPPDTSTYEIINLKSGKILRSGALFRTKSLSLNLPDLQISGSGKTTLLLKTGDIEIRSDTFVLPAWLSILPPLLAIALALITRQVILALFFGIWLGVGFIYQFNFFYGFLHTLDEYVVKALADGERISILLFSLVLGGMVGVISRSGGTQGIVEYLSRYANSARRGQLATWAMGVLIFFDDYANTLIVGNTMRPLADKLKISREKLSYLVDSTAAPVANIAIISTWIGYEISLINQSFESMGIEQNAYITFIKTIPYNFYPVYALVFGFLIAFLQRDFGGMLTAERRARSTGQVLRNNAAPLADLTSSEIMADENVPKRWYNAFIPIFAVIFAVSAGLVYTGYRHLLASGTSLTGKGFIQQISLIIGNADSFTVLIWASFFGSICAIILAVAQRILSLQDALDAWVRGIRSMMMAAIILTAAWSIGMVCQDLYTADYVIHLTRNFLSPDWLPLITFVTAGVVAFATGTSWGTMAILMPIAIPLAVKFPAEFSNISDAQAQILMLSTTASVLAGATFGDHCSPISDTTIMSSMASGADHIDHVRTQLPYALVTGLAAIFFGYIPVGMGWASWWILFPGFAAIFLIIRFAGKRSEPVG